MKKKQFNSNQYALALEAISSFLPLHLRIQEVTAKFACNLMIDGSTLM